MIFFQVSKFASGLEVFTTSLNRKCNGHYYTLLKPNELLTYREFLNVTNSGKVHPRFFTRVELNKNQVKKNNLGQRFLIK